MTQGDGDHSDAPGEPGQVGEVAIRPTDGDIERAISSVTGVASATVRRDPDTDRTRLRLRVRPGEDPDRVAWAVAATLRERFGIALDPAAIRPVVASADGEDGESTAGTGDGEARASSDEASVAPEAEDAGPDATTDVWTDAAVPESAAGTDARNQPAPPAEVDHIDVVRSESRRAEVRPTIRRLDIEGDDDQITVTVALRRRDHTATGQARTVPASRSVLRAIAEATAAALEQFTVVPLRVSIDRVVVDPDADPPRVLVALTRLAERGEEELLGVSLIRADSERAVVRATLDALNRRVEPLLATAADAPPAE